MTTQQIMVALLLLCTLTNNDIKAMDRKRWSLSTHPLHPNNTPFPQATQAPYKYNPELYERDFTRRLELYLKDNNEKSEAHLNIYKKHLLRSMQQQKVDIAQRQHTKSIKVQIRFRYYPQALAITWKK